MEKHDSLPGCSDSESKPTWWLRVYANLVYGVEIWLESL